MALESGLKICGVTVSIRCWNSSLLDQKKNLVREKKKNGKWLESTYTNLILRTLFLHCATKLEMNYSDYELWVGRAGDIYWLYINTADHLTCMRLPDVGIQLSWCPVGWCFDNTVRKLFSIYIYVPCCIFLVKMFRNPRFKLLVRIFCYVTTRMFLGSLILISQILHHFRCSSPKFKIVVLLCLLL